MLTPNNNHSVIKKNNTTMFVKTSEDIEMPSDFSPSKDKGYSFGASRDVYKKVFTKTQPFIPHPDMPGPGSYDIQSFVERMRVDNKSFVIGKKDNHEYPLTFPQNPGPGYYQDTTNFNSHGNYFHSKFSNSGSQKFTKSPRNFLKIKNQNPGPGSYDPKTLINQEGRYFVSTYKNSLTRKFGSGSNNAFASTTAFTSQMGFNNSSMMNMSMNEGLQKKLSINEKLMNSTNSKMGSKLHFMHQSMRNVTPGPGSYRIISEFGKYDMNGQYYSNMNNNFNMTSTMSPALIETSSTTPVKRAMSALGSTNANKKQGKGGQHRRANSSLLQQQILGTNINNNRNNQSQIVENDSNN